MNDITQVSPEAQIHALVKKRAAELLADATPALNIPAILENEFPSEPRKKLLKWYKATLREYAKSDEDVEKEKPESRGQQIILAEYLFNLAVKHKRVKDALDILKYLGTLKGLDRAPDPTPDTNINILNHMGGNLEHSDTPQPFPMFVKSSEAKRIQEESNDS